MIITSRRSVTWPMDRGAWITWVWCLFYSLLSTLFVPCLLYLLTALYLRYLDKVLTLPLPSLQYVAEKTLATSQRSVIRASLSHHVRHASLFPVWPDECIRSLCRRKSLGETKLYGSSESAFAYHLWIVTRRQMQTRACRTFRDAGAREAGIG